MSNYLVNSLEATIKANRSFLGKGRKKVLNNK